MKDLLNQVTGFRHTLLDRRRDVQAFSAVRPARFIAPKSHLSGIRSQSFHSTSFKSAAIGAMIGTAPNLAWPGRVAKQSVALELVVPWITIGNMCLSHPEAHAIYADISSFNHVLSFCSSTQTFLWHLTFFARSRHTSGRRRREPLLTDKQSTLLADAIGS